MKEMRIGDRSSDQTTTDNDDDDDAYSFLLAPISVITRAWPVTLQQGYDPKD